jgi:hypothetical protein
MSSLRRLEEPESPNELTIEQLGVLVPVGGDTYEVPRLTDGDLAAAAQRRGVSGVRRDHAPAVGGRE